MVAGVVSIPVSQPSVLVIDDEQEIREFFTDFLSLEGFDVTTIADPSTAVDRIRGEAFDLILLDLMMPKIYGLDLLPMIRAVDGTIPVILMTTADPVDLLFDDTAVACEVSGYIRHPLTTIELREVIFGATGFSIDDDEDDADDDDVDDEDEDDDV